MEDSRRTDYPVDTIICSDLNTNTTTGNTSYRVSSQPGSSSSSSSSWNDFVSDHTTQGYSGMDSSFAGRNRSSDMNNVRRANHPLRFRLPSQDQHPRRTSRPSVADGSYSSSSSSIGNAARSTGSDTIQIQFGGRQISATPVHLISPPNFSTYMYSSPLQMQSLEFGVDNYSTDDELWEPYDYRYEIPMHSMVISVNNNRNGLDEEDRIAAAMRTQQYNTTTTTTTATTGSTCCICHEDYNDGETIGTLQCSNNHQFHENCIKKWLKRKNTCPLCREVI